MELLEPDSARPRQARYQAALRPDMKYVKIIMDFRIELLLHLTKFAFHSVKTHQMDFTKPSLRQVQTALRWFEGRGGGGRLPPGAPQLRNSKTQLFTIGQPARGT